MRDVFSKSLNKGLLTRRDMAASQYILDERDRCSRMGNVHYELVEAFVMEIGDDGFLRVSVSGT